jgi:hypothetical protein
MNQPHQRLLTVMDWIMAATREAADLSMPDVTDVLKFVKCATCSDKGFYQILDRFQVRL